MPVKRTKKQSKKLSGGFSFTEFFTGREESPPQPPVVPVSESATAPPPPPGPALAPASAPASAPAYDTESNEMKHLTTDEEEVRKPEGVPAPAVAPVDPVKTSSSWKFWGGKSRRKRSKKGSKGSAKKRSSKGSTKRCSKKNCKSRKHKH